MIDFSKVSTDSEGYVRDVEWNLETFAVGAGRSFDGFRVPKDGAQGLFGWQEDWASAGLKQLNIGGPSYFELS